MSGKVWGSFLRFNFSFLEMGSSISQEKTTSVLKNEAGFKLG